MLMKTFFSTLSEPDYYRSYNSGYCEGNKHAYEHLIFSFRMDKKRAYDINNKKSIYADFNRKREFKEELAGKSSSDSDFSGIHKSFCQKFSSSAPCIHIESLSWIGNYVKSHNHAPEAKKAEGIKII